MRLAIKRMTVYLRLLVVVLVVGVIGLILFQNRNYGVQVWLFGLTDPNRQVNVVWVMLATALCTLVAWWMVRFTRGLLADIREVHAQQVVKEGQLRQEQQVAALDDRQRRIEDQLKHASELETDEFGG